MGKDFFSRKAKSDFFETPYSMTEQLLTNEYFDDNKWCDEPARGNQAIVRILNKYFKYVSSSDISLGRDFLKSIHNTDYIITNPPFSQWDEFIQKAKQVTIEKFAFLGRLEFLTGIKRFNEKLYRDPEYPLTKVYTFVRKVNLTFTEEYPELREDGKYPAGMYHYAWFIFDRNGYEKYGHFCFPIIRWIDNNKYILRSKDIK